MAFGPWGLTEGLPTVMELLETFWSQTNSLEAFWRLSGESSGDSLETIWRLAGGSLEALWELSGSSLEISGSSLELSGSEAL